MKKTIVYLVDEAGEKGFYVIEDGKIISTFKRITIFGYELYDIGLPSELPKGFKAEQLTLDEVSIEGLSFEDEAFANYKLIYAMDKNGETHYYQVELTEGKMQLYSGAAPMTLESVEDIQDSLSLFKTFSIVFAVIAVGCAGYIGYSFFKKKK